MLTGNQGPCGIWKCPETNYESSEESPGVTYKENVGIPTQGTNMEPAVPQIRQLMIRLSVIDVIETECGTVVLGNNYKES